MTDSEDLAKCGPACSPDGRYVAYTTKFESKVGLKALNVLNLDSGKLQAVVPASDLTEEPITQLLDLRWSPTGDHIAAYAYLMKPGLHTGVGVIDWPSGKFRWLCKEGRSGFPRWTADGRKVRFARNETQIWEASPGGGDCRVVARL